MVGFVEFDDSLQGHITQHLESEIGDYVVKRADGLFAYQLAVVVDDIDQGVTDIVRGEDLIASTGRQLFLRQLLQGPPVRHAHIPVVTDAQGVKLSKQTRAPAIPLDAPLPALQQAIAFLGQHGFFTAEPPLADDAAALLRWGARAWAKCYNRRKP